MMNDDKSKSVSSHVLSPLSYADNALSPVISAKELLVKEARRFKYLINAFAFTIILLQSVAPNMALAKRGGDDDSRAEFYGIVQERPESGLYGEWVIGGRIFTTDAGTEFDQSEGNLVVGSCAKVQVRNGRVHEIDSEPMRDCQ